jgi:hypothetical protein
MAARAQTLGGPWPTPKQELLLTAAVGEGPCAREALSAWETEFDPARVDHESLTLLPLLSRNLASQRLDSPFAPQYAAVYRWSWYRNQLLFAALRSVLQELHAAGVGTLLLKGAALSYEAFRDPGVRPMGDCDLAVPVSQVPRAVDVLRTAGFQPVVPFDAMLVTRRHSTPFRDVQGREIDLHWHVLPEDIGPGADGPFWEASRPLVCDGVQTRTLCPADHLLLIASHAMQGSLNTSPIYWIADAVVLLQRSTGEVDWPRLVEQARLRKLTLTVRRSLEYVADTFGAPVPRAVRTALGEQPVSTGERFEHWVKVRNLARSPIGALPQYWFTHMRLCDRLGKRPGLRSFLRFFRQRHPLGAGTLAWRACVLPFHLLVWFADETWRRRTDRPRAAMLPTARAHAPGGRP